MRFVGGWVQGRLKTVARSPGTWRECLTWRRLRGEGSAVQELHCEHKAKAEGEGRDQQPPRLASLAPLQKKRATPTIYKN